ncbi:MAG: glycerol-3-phosphate acyltransferase [candidate division WOR-3 bacterium]
MVKVLFLILLGYLFGSIPNAVLISKLKRIDIRKVGTGNPGAGNVFREVGAIWGILTFVLDAIKAVIPMLIADKVLHFSLFWTGIVGLFAVIGHCHSLFLNFRGGKGVASSGGVLIYLFPKFSLIAIASYFIIQRSPRNPKFVLPIFLLAFSLWILLYWNSMPLFFPFIFIFFTVGIILNIDVVKEFIKGGNK